MEYLAITDHSASHGFGNDVSARASWSARIEEIRALNERLDGIELLIGTETNILTDGSPDYPDELLERLDWVIASVHTSFPMGEQGDDRPHGGGDRAPAGSTPSGTRPGARSRRATPTRSTWSA